MSVLSPRDAYRLWAPSYDPENAVSFLEQRCVAALTPPLEGLRLLDAGCGTGRRLAGIDAQTIFGVDLSPEMLAAGSPGAQVTMLVGDVRALPLARAAFDVVWCRLVLGHVPDCRPVYAELARVAAPGATVIVTDFHPDAYAAGHRRTFRADGQIHEVEHHVHAAADQRAAAGAAGLDCIAEKTAAIGPSVKHFYTRAGRTTLYNAQRGLPVVLALAYRKAR